MQSVADIKHKIEERKRKLIAFGLTLQPLPTAVGETLQSIESAYVFLDDHIYEAPTLLKAVDLTFKIVHAQHLLYTHEAEQVWYVIQLGLFNIKTEWDKNYVSVTQLLSDLGNTDNN